MVQQKYDRNSAGRGWLHLDGVAEWGGTRLGIEIHLRSGDSEVSKHPCLMLQTVYIDIL